MWRCCGWLRAASWQQSRKTQRCQNLNYIQRKDKWDDSLSYTSGIKQCVNGSDMRSSFWHLFLEITVRHSEVWLKVDSSTAIQNLKKKVDEKKFLVVQLHRWCETEFSSLTSSYCFSDIENLFFADTATVGRPEGNLGLFCDPGWVVLELIIPLGLIKLCLA